MYKKLLLIGYILLFFLLNLSAQENFESMNIPTRHKQMVLVKALGWNSQTATLQRYRKADQEWIPIGDKINVNLGKNGLGWGLGLHTPEVRGPEKIEGDGKAPAGIFQFGTAFGYETNPLPKMKIPYRQATSRDYWVDAANSSEYNTWVRINEDKLNDPKKYWRSFERLKRADHLYELGLVVKHNMEPVAAGKGSAIFFHIWRQAGSPTSGCTAMKKEDLKLLLTWLDPDKHPILIQVPKNEIGQVTFE